MLGLFALPTPPQDEQEVNPKGPSTYALPAISGQPPPPDIFYRPTAEPQPRASGSRSPSWPRRHPGSPPTPPERQVLYEGVGSKSLPIEDRPVMFALMSLGTSPADCQMAVDVINHLIPPGPGSPSLPADKKREQDTLVARYLRYWLSLTPHSLCVLIGTIILLERLRSLHPSLSSNEEINDTTLRVVFSAYLLAMKLISDVSYTNSAFLRRCPWSQSEINSMERELLHHLNYDAFISSGVLLERAKAFWSRRESEQARLQGDDGIPDFTAGGVFGENLFQQGRKEA